MLRDCGAALVLVEGPRDACFLDALLSGADVPVDIAGSVREGFERLRSRTSSVVVVPVGGVQRMKRKELPRAAALVARLITGPVCVIAFSDSDERGPVDEAESVIAAVRAGLCRGGRVRQLCSAEPRPAWGSSSHAAECMGAGAEGPVARICSVAVACSVECWLAWLAGRVDEAPIGGCDSLRRKACKNSLAGLGDDECRRLVASALMEPYGQALRELRDRLVDP